MILFGTDEKKRDAKFVLNQQVETNCVELFAFRFQAPTFEKFNRYFFTFL